MSLLTLKDVPAQYIVIEGPDGSGKGAQVALLKEYLEAQGLEVLVVREPGGTEFGEELRTTFKKHFGKTDPVAEVLLMLAGRRQLKVEVIDPALQRGVWVLSDRHTPSTYAYQGAGQGLGFSRISDIREGLGNYDSIAHQTVILTVPAAVREERMDARGDRDVIDNAGIIFHDNVANAYTEIADGCWHLKMGVIHSVNGEGTMEEVHTAIVKVLSLD